MYRDVLFKILLIGDSGVGKTSVIMRYTKNLFNEDYLNSIGVDFKSKDLYIEEKKIKLQIWDTAGQERFRTITSSYYRGAHAIAVVFDLTKRQSYDHVKRWMEDINKYAKENVLKFLVGNKSDLKDEIQVSYEEARALASQMKTTYFSVSAKKNENINEFFEAATKLFLIKFDLYEEDNQRVVLKKNQISNKDNKKKGNAKKENC
jgi:Ras-related protein Rab-1A